MKPKEICNSLNRILPNDIFIKSIKLVDDLFNARFSAKSKTYIYKISNDVNGVFINNYTLKYNKPLNIKKMKQAANLLIGKHNFLSFSISEVEDTVRVIKSIKITNNGSVTLITITGNGFLRAMVRMIVGMLLDVNENKKTLDDVKNLLSNPKKGSSITKVKACGLYLNKVKY
jgi:tRNA pseudouridine38-40 synthase